MTFEWITGRSLSKITKGNAELEMMYDCNGMRTQKKVGNDITNYYYDSSNNLIGLTNGNNTLFFYYDSYGMPTSFAHNGTMYYYVKNLQGDIVQITKQDGTVVAKYVYDVWGKILSIKDGSNNTIESTNATHLANLNPFRYRGYVYDNETGLYYLQSRYYDPITGRFLNADVYCDTGTGSPISTNMFAYCENNAIINFDTFGLKTTKIVNPSPFFRYRLVFDKRSLSKKVFVCYLTSAWTKATNYQISKRLTLETTITGNISGGLVGTVCFSAGVALKISFDVSTTATIPADHRKFSKLALYAKFNQLPFNISAQNRCLKINNSTFPHPKT